MAAPLHHGSSVGITLSDSRDQSPLMCSFDADEDAVAVGILDVDDRADDARRDGLADSLTLVAADAGNEAQGGVHEADGNPQVHDLPAVLGDSDAQLSARRAATRQGLDVVARLLD